LPLKEEALPATWVADFLSPPFRDAAPPPGTSDSSEQTLEDDSTYWCPGYEMGKAMVEQAEEENGGHIQSDVLQINRQNNGYSNYMFRLPRFSPDEGERGSGGDNPEVTPTAYVPASSPMAQLPAEAGESDPAEESSAPEGLLAAAVAAASGEAAANAKSRGVAAAAAARSAAPPDGQTTGGLKVPYDQTGGLSSAVPWKVPVPSYGPFGGSFEAFPGFLVTAGLATSCPQWKGIEPQTAL
jgi:hypothetical protein